MKLNFFDIEGCLSTSLCELQWILSGLLVVCSTNGLVFLNFSMILRTSRLRQPRTRVFRRIQSPKG